MSCKWIEAALGDYIDFKNGKSSPERNEGEPYSVYGSNGVIGYSKTTNAPENCLIIGRVGSYCGSIYHSSQKCWVTDNAIIGLPKSSGESEFWYFLLKKLELNSYRSGSGQPLLNQATLSSISIKIPVDSTVRAEIGEKLMTFYNKIHLNTQTNQTLESIAQAIFKSWFVDFEPVKAKMAAKERWYAMQPTSESASPVCYANDAARPDLETYTNLAAMCAISGKSETELAQLQQQNPDHYQQLAETAALFPSAMVDSELGEIPEGWEVSTIGENLSVLETGTRPKGGVGGIKEGVPSVGAENINGVGNYSYGKEKFVSSEFFSKMRRGKVENLDFLLYKDGGKPGDFKPRVSMFGCGFPYDEFAINEHVFRIRSSMLGQAFLYFQIGHERILAELSHKGAKAAIPGINQTDVTSTRIVRPTEGVLTSFNNQSILILESILKRAKENLRLSQLRDSLLPKLLSGEIDLTEIQSEEP